MNVVMMTSLPAADCSMFLPLRRKKLDRQWFGDGSEVQMCSLKLLRGIPVAMAMKVSELSLPAVQTRSLVAKHFYPIYTVKKPYKIHVDV